MKYHLARGEEKLGTFNDLDVSAGMREGRFLATDLCWAEGMPEWQALGTHMREVSGTTEIPAIKALREEVRQDEVQTKVLASLGQRFGAKMIDWLLLLLPVYVLLIAIMDATFEAKILALREDPTAMMEALKMQTTQALEAGNQTVFAMYGVISALMIANVVLLTLRGQSIGKLLTGIKIVRAQDQSRAGFVKAVMLRWFLFAVINSI